MITLYNVISSDGFIARNDGNEDFIPDGVWPEFLRLCREYDAIILSRKAYEAIQGYDENILKQFEDLLIKKIVVSGNQSFNPKNGYVVVRSPEDAISHAPDALVSSGPTMNNFLLRNHLVKKIILGEVPVKIGEGIRPFEQKEFPLVPIEKHLF